MIEEKKILKWSAHTDAGRFRLNNEDSFLALQVNREGVFRLGKWGKVEIEMSDFVFAVSDGMGGANAGEYASRLVAEQMTKLFLSDRFYKKSKSQSFPEYGSRSLC